MGDDSNQLFREERESYWIAPPRFRVTESFQEFVTLNPDLRVEQNPNGEIVIVSPVGSEGSNREIEIACQLQLWARKSNGKAFSPSVLFTLPDGSKRGPDASWIAIDRWEGLSQQEREAFAPIAPDFVIELRSKSDRLTDLHQKMSDYLANGIRLGWLIDPFERRVYVYRKDQPMQALVDPTSLSGEDVLLGFELDLLPIWSNFRYD